VYDEFCPAAARGGGGAGVISLSLSLSSGRKLFLIAFFFCSIVRLLLIREVGVGFLSLSS